MTAEAKTLQKLNPIVEAPKTWIPGGLGHDDMVILGMDLDHAEIWD